jgi:FtsZ-binding cell division protein ZapB
MFAHLDGPAAMRLDGPAAHALAPHARASDVDVPMIIPQAAPWSDDVNLVPHVTPPSTAPGSPVDSAKAPKTTQRAMRKATMTKEPKLDYANYNNSKDMAASSSSSTSKRCYKKRRTGGLEGFLAAGPTIDEAIAAGLIPPLPEGDTKEIRKQRRLIRNRVSAQLHRERKKLYLENLESRVREQADTIDTLEMEVERLKAALAAALNQNNKTLASTDGTLSNPSSATSKQRRPKSIRLTGRSEGDSASGNTSPTNAGTDIEADRLSSDSSASDGESNDADGISGRGRRRDQNNSKKKLFNASAPLDVDTSLDFMNGPLLPTPTGASHGEYQNSNPRKRAFVMLGMFFFTALFGGSILNLTRKDAHTGRHLLSMPPMSPAKSIVPLHHYRHHGRHLMSVDEVPPTVPSAPVRGNDKGDDASVTAPLQQHDASSASSLWNDLVDMPVNRTGKCLAANLLSSVSSAVNASQVLAKGKLFPPPSAKNVAEDASAAGKVLAKKLRGVDNAVVPYGDASQSWQFSGEGAGHLGLTKASATRALSSVMTLQQHMQAAMAGPTHNASTILCPKPYGVLGANTSHTLDDNLVLLLPSSSVAQFLNAMPSEEDEKDTTKSSSSSSAEYQWDGTWVEVDATITAIRQIPMYGGKLGGQTNRAILL